MEEIAVGETVVTAIVVVAAAVVVGESRRQKENLGYAVGQTRLGSAVGPNFVLCGDFGGPERDKLGQCSLEGERMWDMDL